MSWSSSTAPISRIAWQGACAPRRPLSRSSITCVRRCGHGVRGARGRCAATSITCSRCCRSNRLSSRGTGDRHALSSVILWRSRSLNCVRTRWRPRAARHSRRSSSRFREAAAARSPGWPACSGRRSRSRREHRRVRGRRADLAAPRGGRERGNGGLARAAAHPGRCGREARGVSECARRALEVRTVTLELALAGVPTVAAYRVSTLEAMLARTMISVDSIILANLVLGSESSRSCSRKPARRRTSRANRPHDRRHTGTRAAASRLRVSRRDHGDRARGAQCACSGDRASVRTIAAAQLNWTHPRRERRAGTGCRRERRIQAPISISIHVRFSAERISRRRAPLHCDLGPKFHNAFRRQPQVIGDGLGEFSSIQMKSRRRIPKPRGFVTGTMSPLLVKKDAVSGSTRKPPGAPWHRGLLPSLGLPGSRSRR